MLKFGEGAELENFGKVVQHHGSHPRRYKTLGVLVEIKKFVTPSRYVASPSGLERGAALNRRSPGIDR